MENSYLKNKEKVKNGLTCRQAYMEIDYTRNRVYTILMLHNLNSHRQVLL